MSIMETDEVRESRGFLRAQPGGAELAAAATPAALGDTPRTILSFPVKHGVKL